MTGGHKIEIWRTDLMDGFGDARRIGDKQLAVWLRDAQSGSKFPRRAALARKRLLALFEPAGSSN